MREGWTYKKLVDECAILYGYPFDSKNFSSSNEDMPLVRIRDVKEGATSTYYKGVYPKEYVIHKGDYLIGMDGEFNISPWQSDDALLNQRVCKIASKSSDMLMRYVYRFLVKELKKIEDETPFVTVKHLSAKKLNQIKLPVPPLSEQQRIVSELDLLSGIIEKKKAQLKEYDQLAQSIFYDMFGDPVTNEKGWDVKKLGELASVKTGPFGSMLHKEDYISNAIPLVNPIHMKDFHIIADMDFTISNEKAEELEKYILQKDDVIFARRGDIGRCAVVTEKENGFLCGTGSLFVRFVVKVASTYIMYVIRSSSFTNELVSNAKGATMLNLNSSIVEELNFPLPPLSLQQSFAEKIEAIEKQKELIKQSIIETETLFNSRMDYYFN